MSTPEREMKAVEAALSGLMPSPGRFDRDRVLFRAGQNAAPFRWLWPCVSTALAIVSVGLSITLALRPGPVVIERIVYRPVEAPVPPSPPQPPDVELAITEPYPLRQGPGYYQVRDQVLRWGLAGLPQPPPLAPSPVPRFPE